MYLTLISVSAFFAVFKSTAAMAATACPSYKTFSLAIQFSKIGLFLLSGLIFIKSLKVTIDFTPGNSSALEASIDSIKACGSFILSKHPYNMFGAYKSAPYIALPVTLSIPSGLNGLVPTILNSLTALGVIWSMIFPHLTSCI